MGVSVQRGGGDGGVVVGRANLRGQADDFLLNPIGSGRYPITGTDSDSDREKQDECGVDEPRPGGAHRLLFRRRVVRVHESVGSGQLSVVSWFSGQWLLSTAT